ncbi:hypothetical protein [Cystobacter fuscus]|uniref:hypothetical protein n=1 Tax=Cystobacter fuscus TaxID=43 RepID=UPI0037C17CC7
MTIRTSRSPSPAATPPSSPTRANSPTHASTPTAASTPVASTSAASSNRVHDNYSPQSRDTKAASVLGTGANNAPKMSNADVRAWYNQKVGEIPALDAQWKAAGLSPEQRARKAAGIRHEARIEARGMMENKADVDALRARDMKEYGNPDGPTFDDLVNKAKAKGHEGDAVYEYILGSSNRTNAEVNAKFAQGGTAPPASGHAKL